MKVFITFGAGGQNYINAGKRLIKQAESTGYFDKTILYTEKDLKNDKHFWNPHSEFISKNKRGTVHVRTLRKKGIIPANPH